MNRNAWTAALAALLAASAAAQIGNPAGMDPATPQPEAGKPAAGSTNTQDRLFVQLLGAGGIGEVEAASLATTRARHGGVQAFARRMQQEHQDASARLAQLARTASVPMPTAPDPDAHAMLARLRALEGPAFDVAYLQGQLIQHQKTVQLLQWEMGNGQEPGLQRHAAATLVVVYDHLRHVQQLIAEVGAAGPQGLALAQAQAAHAGRREAARP
jgi:putative membrane protein